MQIKDLTVEKEEIITVLKEELKGKEMTIKELQKELADLEEKRRREEEERNKKPVIENRKWYIPVKGDEVDEMMAKYLNECPHYVPVKRLGGG